MSLFLTHGNPNMKNSWWKILSIIITMGILIAGFLIPLKPGILKLSADSQRSAGLGETVELKATTYNTYLQSQDDTRAFLLLPDDRLLHAKSLTIRSEAEADMTFEIPSDIEIEQDKQLETNLVIDNGQDGFVHYDKAVMIRDTVVKQDIAGVYSELNSLNFNETFAFPFRPLLYETIRNQFFHVALWMAMFLLLLISCYHSIRYLIKKDLESDRKSCALTTVALVLGIAGILTGSMWAKYTWGAFWTNDVKLNMTAISLLIYFSYWVLRRSINDVDSRARLSGIFNIFAFVTLMILVMVVPRMSDSSLHPGNGGNPAFGSEDLDNTLRAVFYPAIIAYFLIGLWIAELLIRYDRVKERWFLGLSN